MKKLLFAVMTLLASGVSAFAVDGIIGISADRSEKSFVLSNVKTITIKSGNDVSMSVNKNDGSSIDGFQTIVFNEDVDITNAVNNAANLDIQMYPNPVESIIYVNGLDKDADIKVIGTDGKIAKQVVGQQIEVSDLAKGMYLLSADGRMVKFIKK